MCGDMELCCHLFPDNVAICRVTIIYYVKNDSSICINKCSIIKLFLITNTLYPVSTRTDKLDEMSQVIV